MTIRIGLNGLSTTSPTVTHVWLRSKPTTSNVDNDRVELYLPTQVDVLPVEPVRANNLLWHQVYSVSLRKEGWVAVQPHLEWRDGRYFNTLQYFVPAESGYTPIVVTVNSGWTQQGEMWQTAFNRDTGELHILKSHEFNRCNKQVYRITPSGAIVVMDDSDFGGDTYLVSPPNGELWLKSLMKIGESFLFNPEFSWRERSTGNIVPGEGSVRIPHHIELVNVHDRWRSRGNVNLTDVMELRSFDAPSERWFFHQGMMVGWEKTEGGRTIWAHVSRFDTSGRKLTFTPLPWTGVRPIQIQSSSEKLVGTIDFAQKGDEIGRAHV